MRDELKSLYKLKDRLTKDFEAATQAMPEKKALDHAVGLIAILEGQTRQSRPESEKVIHLRHKKQRSLSSDKEKKAMLDWLSMFFRRTNNQPALFRDLTDLMLADGVKIPGPPDKQVFVVAGLVTRNKMFTGKNRLWHLAKFAA